MSIEAHAVLALGVHRAVIRDPDAAVLDAPGRWHEPVDAPATRLTIDDLAKGVETTGVLARIHTAMLVTDGVHRAVLGPGAISLRLAAVRVRVADVIRRAFAHGVVGRPRDTERSRMTGVRTAGLHGDALDIGHRVRS